jgi:hypothetical protein
MRRLAAVLALVFLVSTFTITSGNTPQRGREKEDISDRVAEGDCETNFRYSMNNYASRLMTEDRQTIPGASVQVLDVEGSRNGGVSIKGWDQADILVRACKLVGADDDATAQAMMNQLAITTEGGRVRAIEPQKGEGQRGSWVVQFTIFVPRDLAVEASVHNGGLSLYNLTGKVVGRAQNGGIAISRSGGVESPIELFAQNGGISLKDVEGRINARTANGGISLSGGRGDVKITSQNGGIVIRLPEGNWAGEALEARSENGGLILHVPQGFSSGIEAETSAHARLDCRVADCPQFDAQAAERGPKRVHLGAASPTVRVSTRNGGLQILPAK